VAAALACVYDPCSVAAGRPVSIVDLGLLVDVVSDADGHVTVVLRTTFPGCTMAGLFSQAAETSVLALDGVHSVSVQLRDEWDWTPDAVTPAGRRLLGEPAVMRASSAPVPWARRRTAVDASAD
jgi:metal-sulfur cluster biosynthetic enzyme